MGPWEDLGILSLEPRAGFPSKSGVQKEHRRWLRLFESQKGTVYPFAFDLFLGNVEITPMKSMTGFGRQQGASKDVSLDISVKSVNGRYLDIKVLCPRIYSELEGEIKKEVGRFFQRGTIEIYIHRQSQGLSEELVFNHDLAKKWLNGFRKLANSLKVTGEVAPDLLVNIPDLYRVEESRVLKKSEKSLLSLNLKEALAACLQEREREGLSLKKDLLGYTKDLKKYRQSILNLRKKSEKEFRGKYEQRLQKIREATDFEDTRLIQEIAILLEKSDISEELQRLETHFSEIEKLVENGDRVGKKLDFFAQELLREVNTIGSKSATAEITQNVVECKGTIEKFREQVQNIE